MAKQMHISLATLLCISQILVILTLQTARGRSILDVTSTVNAFLKNSDPKEITPMATNANKDFNIFYKTDLPIFTFIEEKLEQVLLIVDTLLQHGNQDRYDFYLGATSPNNFASNANPKILFSKQRLLARIKTVVIDWSSLSCTEDVSQLIEVIGVDNLKEFMKTNFNTSIPIGLSYSPAQTNCWGGELKRQVVSADFVIIKVKFVNSHFVASRAIIEKYLDKLETDTSKLMQTATNKKGIAYHVELVQESVPRGSSDPRIFRLQQALLWKFALEMCSVDKKSIIMEPIDSNKRRAESIVKDAENFDPLKFVTPTSFETEGNVEAPEYFEIAKNLVGSVYTRIEAWRGCQKPCSSKLSSSPEIYSSFTKYCLCRRPMITSSKHSRPFHIFLEFRPSAESYESDVAFFGSTLVQNLPVDMFVLFLKKKERLSPKEFSDLSKYNPSATFACNFILVEITKGKFYPEGFTGFRYESEAGQYCHEVLNFTETQIWRVKFNLESIKDKITDYEYLSQTLFKRLEEAILEREDFMKKNPGKKVTLHLDVTKFERGTELNTMYCSETKVAYYEFTEALASWATIRKIPVILNSVMGDEKNPGWLGALSPPPGLRVSSKTFLPMKRNIPNSMSQWLKKKVEPCINKTENIPSDGITFNESLAGVSFDVNIRSNPLSINELEVMLQIVMHKFLKVELQLGMEVESVKNATIALDNVLSKNPEWGWNVTEFFVEVSLPKEDLRRQQYLEEVKPLTKILKDNSKTVISGVHVLVVERDQTESPFLSLISSGNIMTLRNMLNSDVKIGVSFPSCIPELNTLLEMPKSDLQKSVDYIFCNGNIPKKEMNPMDYYLDGYLVVRNAFQKLYPGLELHFKIDISGQRGLHFSEMKEKKVTNAEVLSFVEEVSQFSNIYNLSYFLSPAFGSTLNRDLGWWQITSYVDVSDTTVFVEKEAYLLGKVTWVPNPEEKEQDSSNWMSSVLWTTGVIFVMVILLANIIGCIRCRKKSRVLSKVEVDEFLKGKSDTIRMTSVEERDYLMLGFNLKYEIPKVDINPESCVILGQGNFGTVYKAKVRESNVAVKVPKDHCSKGDFKSLLSEVKLLCYIGDHVNIVKFVGAYVKEIKKGIIQVATVICINGSLLSYLRSMKENISSLDDTEIDQNEMIQFCKEIASGMAYLHCLVNSDLDFDGTSHRRIIS